MAVPALLSDVGSDALQLHLYGYTVSVVPLCSRDIPATEQFEPFVNPHGLYIQPQ